jgi:tetraacyldisaccharide 4'-kinase
VTTAKDAVRLSEAARAMVHVLPVTVTWDDPAAIRHLLTPYMTSSLPNAQ